MFYVESDGTFFYTKAQTSYWPPLVTDGDVYLNTAAAKEVPQRTHFKSMTQQKITCTGKHNSEYLAKGAYL